MAQDDFLLERIAPGPYNWYRSWGLARNFPGVSRGEIQAVSGCTITSETTRVLGREKSGTIGVTDDAVLVSDGNGLAERIDRSRASGAVEISEYRDTAAEQAQGMASMVTGGVFASSAVESADVTLPTSAGDDLELSVKQSTKSGQAVVSELRTLFPDAGEGDEGRDSAIEQLREQYAKGEISQEEFEERRRTLEG